MIDEHTRWLKEVVLPELARQDEKHQMTDEQAAPFVEFIERCAKEGTATEARQRKLRELLDRLENYIYSDKAKDFSTEGMADRYFEMMASALDAALEELKNKGESKC